MTISLSEPWPELVAGMLLPGYILFLFARRKLKKCAQEVGTRRSAAIIIFCLWQLRWHLFAGIVSVGIVWALVIGPHRQFLEIDVDDAGLTLDYPWPRSNVHLTWQDVSGVSVDTRKSGVLGATRFALRVESDDAVFYSPWSAETKEIQQAQDLIQSRLIKQQRDSLGIEAGVPPRGE